MKISELPKITGVRRDIELPLAVQDENYSISLGQIMDALSQGMVLFGSVENTTANVEYDNGETTTTMGAVIFDKVTNKFYYRVLQISGGSPSVTYYKEWPTRDQYYNGTEVKQDCFFIANDGGLYFFNGTTLKSVGITEAQATQIRLNTPIEVSSEEEMLRRIVAGEYEEGQLYYVAE